MPRFMKKEFYHYGRKAGFLAVLFTLAGYVNQTVMAKEQGKGEESVLSVSDIATLAQKLHPDLKESTGWAEDITAAFQQHKLTRERNNVCAVLAIIDKESRFSANPSLPGAKKLAAKLQKPPSKTRETMEAWIKRHPTLQQEYTKVLAGTQSEYDLDMAYRKFVSILFKKKLASIQKIRLLRGWIEKLNSIDTIGAMQVSVAFALKTEQQRLGRRLSLEEIWILRDSLYSRRGGLSYGILRLLGYDPHYNDMRYRFADYNAGRFSSRNAAFQKLVWQLGGQKLALDGDLLRYRKSGKPTFRKSGTEKAVRKLVRKKDIALANWEIHADLMQEKQPFFPKTQTYQALYKLYQKENGTPAPFAIVPDIKMHTIKSRHVLTVAGYATSANKRYQDCIKTAFVSAVLTAKTVSDNQ